MPAKSKKQQRFMGMVHQCKKTGNCASAEVEKAADSMKSKDAKDFASTKHKNLPNQITERYITFKEYILENSDPGYNAFMKEVDKILENMVGLGHQHLEDWVWYSAYEDEYSPEDAVNAFMEETGMDMY